MRDKTCGEVARYIARLVSWFTNGGTKDECGNWHPSGHHHKWAVLSVLNEVQHEHFGPDNMGKSGPSYGVDAAKIYTTCFDAIVKESRKVYPTLEFVGPCVCNSLSLSLSLSLSFSVRECVYVVCILC